MSENISTGRKIWMFPLTRMVVGFIICLVMWSLSMWAVGKVLPLSISGDSLDFIAYTISAIVITLTYVLLYRAYEKRQITELRAQKLGRNIGLGILLGFGLLSMVVLVIYLAANLKVLAVNSPLYMLPAFGIGIVSGIMEEILFRGVIFRISEEWLGSYTALILSGLLFGLMHANNEGANAISIANVALAGMLLAATYMYSRNLWLPIAFHFAWNFAQGGIYGAAVSGHIIDKSLLKTEITGNELITGGTFGPEASVQAVIFLLVTFIAFMLLNKHNGQILPPSWKRKRVVVDETELPISS